MLFEDTCKILTSSEEGAEPEDLTPMDFLKKLILPLMIPEVDSLKDSEIESDKEAESHQNLHELRESLKRWHFPDPEPSETSEYALITSKQVEILINAYPIFIRARDVKKFFEEELDIKF